MRAFPRHEAVPRPTPVEDHLRLVIDTIPALVLSARPDGSVDFINQRWLEFTGLKLLGPLQPAGRAAHSHYREERARNPGGRGGEPGR
jgi:PAS domain-containing protein